MKLEHVFPYLVCRGREYSALQPISLACMRRHESMVEIWLSGRIGVIFLQEETITLNNLEHTVYRGEHRPEMIHASDCRIALSRHLDNNSDLFESDVAERIHWFYTYIEER